MIFNLITKIRLNLAARRYARRLGPQLRRDYGGGADYTVGQIRAAVKKCHLPVRHIKLGFAAFMDEATFRRVADKRDWPAYEALRSLYFEWLPGRSYAEVSSPPENVGIDLSRYLGR